MSDYFNPATEEELSREALCVRMNVSLPEDCETFDGWHRLHRAPFPGTDGAHVAVPGPVELVDGKYARTWVLEELPAGTVAARRLQAAKEERSAAVSAIRVTVDGMAFDGDEAGQERMARTLTAAQATGAAMSETTAWVLADNTVAQPSLSQLARALRQAGEEQTRLWVVPYEGV